MFGVVYHLSELIALGDHRQNQFGVGDGSDQGIIKNNLQRHLIGPRAVFMDAIEPAQIFVGGDFEIGAGAVADAIGVHQDHRFLRLALVGDDHVKQTMFPQTAVEDGEEDIMMGPVDPDELR